MELKRGNYTMIVILALCLQCVRSMESNTGLVIASRDVGQTIKIPFRKKFYFNDVLVVDATIGVPPQKFVFTLDFASGDTVISNLTSIWNGDAFVVDTSPSLYDTTKSTTSKRDILTTSYINYNNPVRDRNGRRTVGKNSTYGYDEVTIGAAPSQEMTFITRRTEGTGNGSSEINWAQTEYRNYTLGLGLPANLAAKQDSFDGPRYQSYIQRIWAFRQLGSRSYSLWFDSEQKESGTLLLGGINTKRFKPPLLSPSTSLSINPSALVFGTQNQLVVTLSSLKISTSTNQPPTPISFTDPIESMALIASNYAAFPSAVAQSIWDAVGASYNLTDNSAQMFPTVPCTFLANTSTLDIQFAGLPSSFVLLVPMKDITYPNGNGPTLTEGPNGKTCRLTIQASPLGVVGQFSIGMMKNLYTVVDQDNFQYSIAQTDFDSVEDAIVEIPDGGVTSIPASLLGSAPTATGKSTAGSTSNTAVSNGGGSSNKVGIGAGVGAGVGVSLLVAIGGFFFWRRRKSRKAVLAGIEMGERKDGSVSPREATGLIGGQEMDGSGGKVELAGREAGMGSELEGSRTSDRPQELGIGESRADTRRYELS